MEHARKCWSCRPLPLGRRGELAGARSLHPQDADGNTILATHCGIDTADCVVAAEPGFLVATVGARHLLIVQAGDAILVADRREEGTVKNLVELSRPKAWRNTCDRADQAAGNRPRQGSSGSRGQRPERRIASPLANYTRRGLELDGRYLKNVIEEEDIGQVVIGLPVHLSGREGVEARAARGVRPLADKSHRVSLHFWDERSPPGKRNRHSGKQA